jgi:hypothetical protein
LIALLQSRETAHQSETEMGLGLMQDLLGIFSETKERRTNVHGMPVFALLESPDGDNGSLFDDFSVRSDRIE